MVIKRLPNSPLSVLPFGHFELLVLQSCHHLNLNHRKILTKGSDLLHILLTICFLMIQTHIL
ncbi:hypothetical protein HanIR_Chr16g0811201 [Helianthus annuus]|nr:hypothetical protein HanIR_Chr16g0811201 [Helianthus annuus]